VGTFRKKPVVVEAVRCSDILNLRGVEAADAFRAMPEWFRLAFLTGVVGITARDDRGDDTMVVYTLEGQMLAGAADWLIRGVAGELYPCKNSIFEASYVELLPDGGERWTTAEDVVCSTSAPTRVDLGARPDPRAGTQPHAFVRGVADGLSGPPDETCAVCAADPRNLIHEDRAKFGETEAAALRVKGDIPADQFAEFKRRYLAEVNAPKVTIRDDGAYAAGPPPDARPVDAHLDELAAMPYLGTRDGRQLAVKQWAVECFGEAEALDIPQRALRLLEEVIESAQAACLDPKLVHKLVDFVYDRPVGEIRQEVAGVSVTLLALAAAIGISADVAERHEVERILYKPRDFFTQRNAAKNAAGFKVTP
jgi:hypothetical protein